ncbi:NUDIX domain-containing protein [Megalodesulfovibrio gigas]|uniref:Putative NUDIX hydrolase n=1 Tax=Megalodesulfovibrio gigas (strain ATCC 19364 / DSM 1382 / NCIMB 9332 / VKM B-1759) TaxID=1121448 RepID=T2GBX1_MEGG1|nr:NUDIX hydrolase [Megalodesulfovibrio gigas]AGW14060.1 putative NUDIX hydrolase [Megalodesulfovibrio gigas DSM 1382 = ATCC 19364]
MTQQFRNPTPTVDVVIYDPARGVLLIERKNPPPGWALPGGFVDEGETVEAAAIREAREETGLDVVLTGLLGVYSDPARDPRKHTMSTVFIGQAVDPGAFAAGDDAGAARFFPLGAWPEVVAFDHRQILEDFRALLRRYNPGI